MCQSRYFGASQRGNFVEIFLLADSANFHAELALQKRQINGHRKIKFGAPDNQIHTCIPFEISLKI